MTATRQSDRAPAPAIIPEPEHGHHSDAPANRRGRPHLRRNVVRAAVAKLTSALRGDKYMVGAYPAESEDAETPVERGADEGER
jgi:hypothetical protein